MNLFTRLKVFFKKYLSFFYKIIRVIFFPLYFKLYRNKKLQKFVEPVFFKLNFLNISFEILLDKKNGFVDEEIFANGIYEPEILQLYKKTIKPGDVCVDIGTNIGLHALFASKLVGETGQVICFEPIKSIFDQLSKSMDKNNMKNIIAHNKAIGQNPGKINIYKNKNNMGASSIALQKGDFTEEIEISNGSELNNLSKINFIKIDTEGYEWEVIQAIDTHIIKYKPTILFEYTPLLYGDEITQKIAILEYFARNNYKMLDVEDNDREIKDASIWYNNFKKIQTNILCIAK